MQLTSSVVLVLLFISSIRAEESGEKCPKANFLPDIPAPGKHCDFGHHCSKVTCIIKAGGHKLTVGADIKKCDDEPLTATVSLKMPQSDLDWSHTLKDEEKVKLKVTPSMFTGGLSVSDASFFIKVGLKKINGSNLNYTVWLVGEVTAFGEVSQVNVLLLQGISPPVTTGDCGSWFSKQPVYVKVLIVVIPVSVLIFVVLGIAMYCYKRGRKRLGSGRVSMERFTNEV